MPDEKTPFIEQMERARRNIASWPEWMRRAATMTSATFPRPNKQNPQTPWRPMPTHPPGSTHEEQVAKEAAEDFARDYRLPPESPARREVGKWLNERPNRPLDLQMVAQLCFDYDQLLNEPTAPRRSIRDLDDLIMTAAAAAGDRDCAEYRAVTLPDCDRPGQDEPSLWLELFSKALLDNQKDMTVEPDAWLFKTSKSGERTWFASTDEDDSHWWPIDQYRLVTRTPLLKAGPEELVVIDGHWAKQPDEPKPDAE